MTDPADKNSFAAQQKKIQDLQLQIKRLEDQAMVKERLYKTDREELFKQIKKLSLQIDTRYDQIDYVFQVLQYHQGELDTEKYEKTMATLEISSDAMSREIWNIDKLIRDCLSTSAEVMDCVVQWMTGNLNPVYEARTDRVTGDLWVAVGEQRIANLSEITRKTMDQNKPQVPEVPRAGNVQVAP